MAKLGVSSFIKAIARDAARTRRQQEMNRKRKLREQEARRREDERRRAQAEILVKRQQAQTERERKQLEKEEKQQYIQSRIEEVDELNAELSERIRDLSQILQHTLDKNDTIAFSSLRVVEEFPPFTPPQELLTVEPPDKQSYLQKVKPMGIIENALGMRGRYQRELQAAEAQYLSALKTYEEKRVRLEQLKKEYENARQVFLRKVQQRDQEVAELEAAYKEGEASAVMTYTSMVLERSEYPEDFPQSFRLAYSQESKEMVVEYEFPGIDVIPVVAEYKYNKAKDLIEEKPRKPAEIKALYQDIVIAITLRTIHEILEADQGNHIQVVTFNGFVNAVDPATGKDVQPCLISVRTTKDVFMDINLERVDKQVCLRNLGARVSSSPEERLPVKPVVEFDMVDRRFIDQENILNNLDSRPNLMDLSPTEFENLVSNLFGKMGLDTKLTRSSKDGGVDAVAFDTRPVLGGKVVIQAKRYKNTVGVSAVRDLYGTMLNEGASKGILVTTSSYGSDAYDFVKDKPLELIDGGGLLYLLDQVGIKAKIIMPSE
ncbi:MAG: restriction endonuclease [Meiothermus sp.]|uniref:restriction endonuclease n=1 Tax=Meiothermus sp. TaxID=1955249 RepID=UPI0021DE9EDB|nr:restriction endonuclease [Meiothermus sp.]GIW29256.1 MAG: restriction endonuclease [Meiothermus sp.]